MRESRGAKIQQRPPVQARGRLWTPAFAGVTDSVLLTHAPLLLREPAARVARLDYWKNVLRGYCVPAKSTMLLPDLAASLCRLVAHPTVEEHAQRCDEGEGLVQHDVVSRLGHLDDGRLRTHQGRHVGRRFTRDERAIFTKDQRGATTHRLQVLAHGLAEAARAHR